MATAVATRYLPPLHQTSEVESSPFAIHEADLFTEMSNWTRAHLSQTSCNSEDRRAPDLRDWLTRQQLQGERRDTAFDYHQTRTQWAPIHNDFRSTARPYEYGRHEEQSRAVYRQQQDYGHAYAPAYHHDERATGRPGREAEQAWSERGSGSHPGYWSDTAGRQPEATGYWSTPSAAPQQAPGWPGRQQGVGSYVDNGGSQGQWQGYSWDGQQYVHTLAPQVQAAAVNLAQSLQAPWLPPYGGHDPRLTQGIYTADLNPGAIPFRPVAAHAVQRQDLPVRQQESHAQVQQRQYGRPHDQAPPDLNTPTAQRLTRLMRRAEGRAGGVAVLQPAAPPPTAKKAPASPKNPRLMLIKRPIPTPAYLAQASKPPSTLGFPRPLLIILDLNGTVIHRKVRGGSRYTERPGLKSFLDYIFTHHRVLIWSSATPANVHGMCDRLFTPEQRAQLVAIKSRMDLRLSSENYKLKVQVYKQLSWMWQDAVVQDLPPGRTVDKQKVLRWDQSNTVLIDDSAEKAASEPHNLLQIDEYEGTPEQKANDEVLAQVVRYLDVLSAQADVSAYMRETPFVLEKGKGLV